MSDMGSTSHSLENLTIALTCFVCNKLAVDPHECPHCTKLACSMCLQMFLPENSKCPKCQKDIRSQPFVSSNWSVRAMISFIMNQQPAEKCLVHSKTLDTYCSDCKQIVCHECILYGPNHTHHEPKKLEKIYEEYSGQITKEVETVKRILLEEMAKRKESALSSKSQRREELLRSFEAMIDDCIAAKAREEVEIFLSQERNEVRNIEQELMDSSQFSLIRKFSSLCTALKEMKDKVIKHEKPITIDFENEYAPSWSIHNFTVKDFILVRQKRQSVESEALKIDQFIWKIKIFLNGYDSQETTDHFAVTFISCENDCNTNYKVEYEFTILHPNDMTKNIMKKGVTESLNPIIHKFRIDSVRSNGFLNSNTKDLHFEFCLRFQTYFQQYKMQKLYNDVLIKRLASLEANNRISAAEITKQQDTNSIDSKPTTSRNPEKDDTKNSKKKILHHSKKRNSVDSVNSERNTDVKRSRA